ncbi:hypothetical protein PAHAL_2G382600 [Panicum hallii]|uniref:HAT C-terminal dimerisation domain-containing protein n=1 Tax=Panicum hallii TaxID=206008 RepID=A0A2T8KRV9_9POAL|nr:hypothetical protein PAHAL_2G382600 [Panicum hallii]
MMTFDFVFILHVMKEIMGITDMLCKKLQYKSQDIVNAMDDVATTKRLIQELRDQAIVCPNMKDLYADFIRSQAPNEITVEHHYRYDIFTVAIEQQAQELNCRFSEQATEFLILCTSLDPSDSFSSFNIDKVCSLASKFYPADFLERERANLRCQLQRAFSAMKINKTRRRNKMEDEFLRNCLVLYIEREIEMKVTTYSIIDAFHTVKNRAVKFK